MSKAFDDMLSVVERKDRALDEAQKTIDLIREENDRLRKALEESLEAGEMAERQLKALGFDGLSSGLIGANEGARKALDREA